MKKISLILVLDYVFKFILLFCLNIIWTLYFFSSGIIALILAIIFSAFEVCLINLFFYKKNKFKAPKLQEKQHIEDVTKSLIFMSEKNILSFFNKLFSQTHQSKIKNNCILLGEESPIVISLFFKVNKLSADDLISIYNNANNLKPKRILVLCNCYDSSIMQILNNFKTQIIILDKIKTYYNFLKPNNFYPEVNENKKTKKKTSFIQIAQIAFSKKKTKSYLLSAIFILFSSLFVSYQIYYLIFASILFIFAILCQCNFAFTRVKEEDLLV